MPTLQITTNTDIADSKALCKAASSLVADMLGKPESYVMVIMRPRCDMLFAGSDAPAALLSLVSLGLPEAKIKSYAKQLCGFLETRLGIAPNRVYINFESPPYAHWGWDNSTFA